MANFPTFQPAERRINPISLLRMLEARRENELDRQFLAQSTANQLLSSDLGLLINEEERKPLLEMAESGDRSGVVSNFLSLAPLIQQRRGVLSQLKSSFALIEREAALTEPGKRNIGLEAELTRANELLAGTAFAGLPQTLREQAGVERTEAIKRGTLKTQEFEQQEKRDISGERRRLKASQIADRERSFRDADGFRRIQETHPGFDLNEFRKLPENEQETMVAFVRTLEAVEAEEKEALEVSREEKKARDARRREDIQEIRKVMPEASPEFLRAFRDASEVDRQIMLADASRRRGSEVREQNQRVFTGVAVNVLQDDEFSFTNDEQVNATNDLLTSNPQSSVIPIVVEGKRVRTGTPTILFMEIANLIRAGRDDEVVQMQNLYIQSGHQKAALAFAGADTFLQRELGVTLEQFESGDVPVPVGAELKAAVEVVAHPATAREEEMRRRGAEGRRRAKELEGVLR